ncbi:MAG: site-2 protease family protein [Christensenella sp.]|nr:site-2 protease family protein [Christensenella sp.]
MLTSIILRNGINMESIVLLFSYLIAILSAIILHEIAHGYAAYYNGDLTAKYAGRLSLNPLKHLDLIGFLMLLFCGFGWAKPVPIDSRNFKDYKKGMIMTSTAGVLCNFVQAFLASICLAVFLKIIAPLSFTSKNALFYFLQFVLYIFYFSMQINIVLMVFNLLPLYPLDGFRIVETLATPNNKYVDFMYRHGRYALIIFIGLNYVIQLVSGYSLFGMVNDLSQLIFNKLWGLILGVSI